MEYLERKAQWRLILSHLSQATHDDDGENHLEAHIDVKEDFIQREISFWLPIIINISVNIRPQICDPLFSFVVCLVNYKLQYYNVKTDTKQ
jgi:hypothetical protein